ncbi:MAG: superfamily II DNA/RNA helicase [Salibacteraceae bacterium]|jgi:superfamily II DNA/RNA helicase
MQSEVKNQVEILKKLGIKELNPMQKKAVKAIAKEPEVILLSPTGTGKTLAFLLPIIANLDRNCQEVQAIILAPSRELAIQIEQVTREMGAGFKTNAVYGGRLFTKDKQDLKHRPAILVGTPGRIADHLRRDTFTIYDVKTIVLDEFDKSLEVGFEEEMSEILSLLPAVNKRILTSATHEVEVPGFVRLRAPKVLDFLQNTTPQLSLKTILSPQKDKLETLVNALRFIGNHNGIIFCNFKDTISRISSFLTENGINHGCFYGGMEQKDRERSLIKFRNGSYQILLATDLAARGIDVPELDFIIHYHLPLRSQEFTHRNGRTARMNNNGTAYILTWEEEKLPEFIEQLFPEAIDVTGDHILEESIVWTTLFISGGRKDKISKGDIAGAFFKLGKLKPNQLGTIELKSDCAFVAVPESKAKQVIQKLNNTKLKKKKVRITLA